MYRQACSLLSLLDFAAQYGMISPGDIRIRALEIAIIHFPVWESGMDREAGAGDPHSKRIWIYPGSGG